MRIVITAWGLDSYLELLSRRQFGRDFYYATLRPDILRLRGWRSDPRFHDPRFWGPAVDRQGRNIEDGYKMKWHNVGPGRIQLRLCVALVEGDAYLCHAYAKTSPAMDRIKAASLRDKIDLVRSGQHRERGVLP